MRVSGVVSRDAICGFRASSRMIASLKTHSQTRPADEIYGCSTYQKPHRPSAHGWGFSHQNSGALPVLVDRHCDQRALGLQIEPKINDQGIVLPSLIKIFQQAGSKGFTDTSMTTSDTQHRSAVSQVIGLGVPSLQKFFWGQLGLRFCQIRKCGIAKARRAIPAASA